MSFIIQPYELPAFYLTYCDIFTGGSSSLSAQSIRFRQCFINPHRPSTIDNPAIRSTSFLSTTLVIDLAGLRSPLWRAENHQHTHTHKSILIRCLSVSPHPPTVLCTLKSCSKLFRPVTYGKLCVPDHEIWKILFSFYALQFLLTSLRRQKMRKPDWKSLT